MRFSLFTYFTLFICILSFSIHCKAQENTLVIPTVVHIVYGEESQDMTDEEVRSLINTVNQNFGGLSNNNSVSRQIFDTLWADTELLFCLADLDENGETTSGILHVQTSSSPILGDFVFPTYFSQAWNTDDYLNIWIFSGGIESLGFGGTAFSPIPIFPEQPAEVPYGVSVNKDCCSTSSVFENILTHELGHYFGLIHTFEPDDVDDTPCSNSIEAAYEVCDPVLLSLNTCSDESVFWGDTDPPDMVENYMSYFHACAKIFTIGQRNRMRNFILSDLTSLLESGMLNTSCKDITNSRELVEVADSLLKIYPNPASSQIFIEGLNPIQQIVFYNAQGKRITSETFRNETTNRTKITTDKLEKGINLIQVVFSDGQQRIQKVLVH